MFSTCLCWFLRLLGCVISVYLRTPHPFCLGPFQIHIMSYLCSCVCLCLPCLCWFEYWLMFEPCMSVLYACSFSSPNLAVSWDLLLVFYVWCFLVNHNNIWTYVLSFLRGTCKPLFCVVPISNLCGCWVFCQFSCGPRLALLFFSYPIQLLPSTKGPRSLVHCTCTFLVALTVQ